MKDYPIFRLTIALVAGILFANTYWTEIAYWSIGVLPFLLLALWRLLNEHSYAGRWIFGAGVSVFMFVVGCVLTKYSWERVKVEWPKEYRTYQGVVWETPQEKTKTYQCRVNVSNKDVLLYFLKDSLSASLKVGDRLLFHSRIESPRNREGFHEFDYAGFLYHRGISGTAFVSSGFWKKQGIPEQGNLKLIALSFREKVIEKYKEWGIGLSRLPILSALTLGYKGDLDKETRDAYSVAGISHVLALSGMHIGIVWLLLDGAFRLLMKRRSCVLKWVLVTIVLWTFAFIVGLEASVVRAVVMCMLMEMGSLSNNKPLSMNTLSVAAFFMLLYRPFYLFDVGFQLSFVAVFSILLLYPLFYRMIPCKNRMSRWIWGMMSVSMSAQLGTAPLVMYYFSNFSLYFMVANLIAGLLVPMIIYGAIVMVALAPFPMMQGWVVKIMNGLIAGLNGCADWISRLPYSSVSLSVWEPIEIILFYIMLFVGVKYGQTKKRKWFIGLLGIVASLLGLHLCLLLAKTIM